MRFIVLTFHGIRKNKSDINITNDHFIDDYTIDYSKFEKIIEFLSNRKHCAIYEAMAYDNDEIRLILTFDDGLRSDYEYVFPLLARYNIKATFFVNANTIDRDGYCTSSQLLEMHLAGMEIGSHGLNHIYLTNISKEKAISEILDSKKKLEDKLGIEINSFAPVGGHYRKWMIDIAQEAGYSFFATMRPGVSVFLNNFVVVHRNHIKKMHDMSYINSLIEANPSIIYKNVIGYYLLLIPKLVFGMTVYDRLKQKVKSDY